ncbi:MAG: glycoside hydrolase family 5 protein [Oscillospiraceae bacterium]|nr:glycoside hydrolase family 5 protein [Oscillospiraceae bacterium]
MKATKITALLLSLAILVSGCASSDGESESSGSGSASETSSTPAESTPPVSYAGEMRGLSVKELVADMKTGWNLGNTFDANEGETSWGNPLTTHEMIDAVAQAGFDLIRIPVTWEQHFDNETDYTINAEWMARVTEVVNYAVDNDMYVIINCHHETDWIKPTMDEVDSVLPKFTAMWKQIAENFKEYGDKLLFEGLNEPRIVGGSNEWNGGTADNRQALNVLNKAFVDTVRATGGNNSTRALLITTVAAAVAESAMKELEIPDDPNIIISLHAYTPYDFTYEDGKDLFYYDDSVGSSIDWVFNLIDTFFTSKDIPVIITEYGSVNKIIDFSVVPNPRYEENVKWVTRYLERAKQSGIPCVWWDNGYHFSGNELFGIFDRNDCTWFAPDLVEAIMNVYK